MTRPGPGNGVWPEGLTPLQRRALVRIEMPTGGLVLGVLPSVDTLVIRGLLPTELRDTAIQVTTLKGLAEAASDDGKAREFTQVLRLFAVSLIRYEWDDAHQPDDPAGWQKVEHTAAELDLFDESDIWALALVALRLAAPEGAKEAVATVSGWRGFREESAGDRPDADSTDVRRTAQPNARRRGSGPRPRARRSPRAQAARGPVGTTQAATPGDALGG